MSDDPANYAHQPPAGPDPAASQPTGTVKSGPRVGIRKYISVGQKPRWAVESGRGRNYVRVGDFDSLDEANAAAAKHSKGE